MLIKIDFLFNNRSRIDSDVFEYPYEHEEPQETLHKLIVKYIQIL